jgi:hypothetical protein
MGLWCCHPSEAALESQIDADAQGKKNGRMAWAGSVTGYSWKKWDVPGRVISGAGSPLKKPHSNLNPTPTPTPTHQKKGGRMGHRGGCGASQVKARTELGSIAPHRRNFRFLSTGKRASARAGTLDLRSAAVALALEGVVGSRGHKNGADQDDGDILGDVKP